MSGVAAVSGGVGKGSSAADAQQLGQDQFLKLMLAQLKNQDPLKPLEPAEFLGQLAQFSTVSGIQAVKGAVTDMAGALRASQALQGATLIGRRVVAVSDHARFDGLTSVTGSIETPTGSSTIDVAIKDSSGAMVRRMRLDGSSGNDLMPFVWDGTTDRGSMAARGTYSIEAVANVGGSSRSTAVQVESLVSSVSLDPASGAISLETENGTLGFSAVRRVK